MKTFAALEPLLRSVPTQWKVAPMRRVLSISEHPNSDSQAQLLSLHSSGTLAPRREDNQAPSPEYLPRYWLVRPGDLVVNPMWLAGGGIGVSSVSGAVSPDYRVYLLGAAFEARYVHYLLRSAPYLAQYRLLMRAETTFDRRVTKEDFRELPIPVPPRPVQRAIADYLDRETERVDAVIEKKQRLIAVLRERSITATDNAILSAPHQERPISALATYINGYPFKPEDFSSEGMPVIRIRQLVDPAAPTDLFDGSVPERVRLVDGDLVFSWSGSLEVRLWNRGPAILNQHLFRVLPAKGVEKNWLRFALETSTRILAGLMHGSAMTHITKTMMKDVRIPLPDQAEQRKLAALLQSERSRLERLESLLTNQLDRLYEHRQALISTAVTGSLDLPEAA
jgi:type I restriction enzyme S subunit